jgi:hypothetical protein
MSKLVQLVNDLAACFDRLELRYALGGALATSFWGVVRTTQDIACLVAIPALDYQRLADELQTLGCRQRTAAGDFFDVSVAIMREQVSSRNLVECIRESVVIDLFTPVVPLQNEILRRAVQKPFGERVIPITTAEDLILIKLAFHRAKDLQDVRGIIRVQRECLDLQYLDHWSKITLDRSTQIELAALLAELG